MANQPTKYKKFVATAATATLVASAIVPVASAATPSFSDIAGNDHESNIKELAELGFIGGYPDGTFKPGNSVTRGQVALMLGQWAQAQGVEVPADYATKAYFNDLPASATDENKKMYALVKAAGIFGGYSDGSLKPSQKISRQQMAIVLNSAYKAVNGTSLVELAGDTSNVEVADINKVNADYRDEVKALKALGITKPANFNPAGDVTRGQFASFLNATIKVDVEVEAAVKSVSAINAKEVVVTFTTALAEGTTKKQLEDAFTLEGATVVPDSAVLSQDRKSVTLTLSTTEVKNAKVSVAALDTAKKDSKGVVIKTAEYNSLLTFEDKTAPAVEKVEAKGTTAVITFTEPVKAEGTVSLDGVAITSTAGYELSADGKTLTVKNLEAEKSYKVDIVGATDFSENVANPIAVNFTVAKPVVDNTKPTVTSSVNGTKITLDFSEELVKQNLDVAEGDNEYAKVTVGTTELFLTDAQQHADDKTKFTVDAVSALGSETFINANVKVEGFKDAANNAGDAFEFAATLETDTTKPSLVSASSKLLVADNTAINTDLDEIYVTFSEPVIVASGNLTLKTKNGVLYTTSNVTTVSDTSGTGVDVDKNGKIEGAELNTVKFSIDLDASSSYSFELAGGLVSDLAGNKITDAIQFNLNTGTYTAAPGTVTDSLKLAATNPVVVDVNNNNVFTVEYAADVTSSALTASNYTLGGKALPAGTQLQFVDGTKKVRFTLPEASITANGNYIFEAKNVIDIDGNTLKDGKATATITLKENIAPTASKVTVANSKTFTVDFSEAIKDAANTTITGLTVKIDGTTVTPATAVVANGKLTVTTVADFKLTDSISVEFNNTNLVDANGNKVKNGVVTK